MYISRVPSLVDLTGRRFGRLVVISRAENFGKRIQWNCRCDCGKSVVIEGQYFRKGLADSCQRGPVLRRNGKRLAADKRLRAIWEAMCRRCGSVRAPNYQYYGGRGIRVCDEWQQFDAFREWALASGYADGLTIDRIDTDGNYSPDNCRWTTRQEQMNNKRGNRRLTIGGETLTAAQASRRFGVNPSTLYARLYLGWSDERAVQPV